MRPGPRWSLSLLSLVHACVFGAAAKLLPWPMLTMFAVLACGLALLHAATFVLAALGARARFAAWRASSLGGLLFCAYFTYAALASGLYVGILYEGVGTAIAAGAAAAWCVGLLFTLPLSVWGIAMTGGVRPGKARARPGPGVIGAALFVLFVFGAASQASDARGQRKVPLGDSALDARVVQALSPLPRPRRVSKAIPQLFVRAPTECASPPAAFEGATVFVTYLARRPVEEKTKRGAPASVATFGCLQGPDLDAALGAAQALLKERWAEGEAIIDVVVTARALPDVGPLLGSVLLRPGFEGACDERRCLLPWQLSGLDAFTEATSIAALSADLGLTAGALRQRLGSEGEGFLGLHAIETRAFLLKGEGAVVPIRHLREGARPLDGPTVEGALTDVAGFVVSSQVADGRFRYLVDPFSGAVSFSGFNVPRQAGTTLAICEASKYDRKSEEAAKRSLSMLTALEQKNAKMGGIVFPRGAKRSAGLGNSALTMIALLRCRERGVGGFDEAIDRLGHGLLATMRDDGGFHPAWDPATGKAAPGRDALYAGGQGVFALVLWERAEGLPARPEGLAAAIDRAMDYTAGPYWDIPLYDFFFLEENWHCLAARAALGSHRHDAYEKFCVDYMTMKSRFISDEHSGIDEDQVGAYAFGHVFPPHHAAAAGYGESLAAVIDIKRKRGLDVSEDERNLRRVLGLLLRHQWRDDNCATCTRSLRIVGGFSENVASPAIRIDFCQHAMSALLHGSQTLRILDGDAE